MSSDDSCNIAIHVYNVGPRKGLFNEIFRTILSANFKCIYRVVSTERSREYANEESRRMYKSFHFLKILSELLV